MDAAVSQLLSNPPTAAKEALLTMIKMSDNIIHKPKEEKFRRLKQSNAALKRKVTDLPGGIACLMALGFTQGEHEGEAAWIAPVGLDQLVDGKARLAVEADRLLNNDTPLDVAKSQANNGPGGIEGMLLKAIQDPGQLQRLLQNPMVAQMARANPDMVEGMLASPQAQAALQSNPDVRPQLEALLGRPLRTPGSTAPSGAGSQAVQAGGLPGGFEVPRWASWIELLA
eukprot:gnl/TRDRNA2_/TRDRNA2_133472_c0_seq2.p1 gnl/TRDRNA2_/TRDRNA2_133472_c0~~gnl/TRDRNA2_/TRDRNA2_133472_c0_seq2.p1  ORF type:complete len:227 (-),score=57.21 gnl/TRDRNA2_/TRDRNA2_133472_c0_seq2:78-758(-)